MFTRAFLNSQSSGHDITLTIFELKWYRQCTRLYFCWAKISLGTSLHSGRSGTTKPLVISRLVTLFTVRLVYSLWNEWPMHNNVSMAALWKESGCVELIDSSTELRNVMMECQFLNSANLIFLIFHVNVSNSQYFQVLEQLEHWLAVVAFFP